MSRILSLIGLALCAFHLGGCRTAQAPQPVPDGWQKFSSARGEFSVFLPGVPTETVATMPSPSGPVEQHSFDLKARLPGKKLGGFFDVLRRLSAQRHR